MINLNLVTVFTQAYSTVIAFICTSVEILTVLLTEFSKRELLIQNVYFAWNGKKRRTERRKKKKKERKEEEKQHSRKKQQRRVIKVETGGIG